MHRNPSKVILPFESTSKSNLKKENIIDLDPATLRKDKQNEAAGKQPKNVKMEQTSLSPVKSDQIKQKREEKLKKQKFYLSQQKVFDDNGDVIYEKLKENDPRVR